MIIEKNKHRDVAIAVVMQGKLCNMAVDPGPRVMFSITELEVQPCLHVASYVLPNRLVY